MHAARRTSGLESRGTRPSEGPVEITGSEWQIPKSVPDVQNCGVTANRAGVLAVGDIVEDSERSREHLRPARMLISLWIKVRAVNRFAAGIEIQFVRLFKRGLFSLMNT